MSDGIQARIEAWDGQAVVCARDADTDSWMFIALHDSTLGPPVGGCRMKTYPSPDAGLLDAMRLAEGMTYKWAAIDFPFGGGKSVLAIPHALEADQRTELLQCFGRLLTTLRGTYRAGVDLGTTPDDMKVIATQTDQVMGVSPDGSESRDPGPYTALGVFVGIQAALRAVGRGPEIAGLRVAVQGVGDVGEPLARLLADAGASLALSDVNAGRVQGLAEELGADVVGPADIYGTACDVFAPCAVGAVLNPETIPRLECRIVAGSANNQLASADDAERLHARGILYAPDYVVNAGGAIAFGLMHRGEEDQEELRRRVRRIEESLDAIFAEAAASDESPEHAARRRAERILERGRAGR